MSRSVRYEVCCKMICILIKMKLPASKTIRFVSFVLSTNIEHITTPQIDTFQTLPIQFQLTHFQKSIFLRRNLYN